MTRERENRSDERERLTDEGVERLLRELRPADLPPFYRSRLMARVRAASGRSHWVERLRAPRVAWSVAGACVVALVLIAVHATRVDSPTGLVVPGVRTARTSIDPVTPADNSVVGAGDVEIIAAIYPPIEGGIVRLYVDERDVTGLAEVTESYVMYSPAERFQEGEHIVTIEITDGSGGRISNVSWLFHTLNGRYPTYDERT